MVRVLAIADEEAPALTPERISTLDIDLVLAAGDLPWAYLEYVACASDRPLVFVPGNHDPEISPGHLNRNGMWVHHGVPTEEPRPIGGLNADLHVVEAAGLRIAGLGGCVRYRSGPHQYDQREYAKRAHRLLRAARHAPVDILLTHAPPSGLGDGDDPPHHGIKALHEVIGALSPTWHLHGHIHPHGHPQPDRALPPTTIANVIPYRVLEVEPKEGGDVQQRLAAR